MCLDRKCSRPSNNRSGRITPTGGAQAADDFYQPIANKLRNIKIRLAYANNENQQ
jgi:hypothetical protein